MFQCARCSSQLSIANYYETENGDYCCDVCPDVEEAAAKVSAVTASREEDSSGGSSTSCEEESEDEKSDLSVADRVTVANDRQALFLCYIVV